MSYYEEKLLKLRNKERRKLELGNIELKNIEVERVTHGQTREEIASILGITSKTYLNWIRGITEIPSGTLIQMSRLWGKSVDYLLEESQKPSE